MYKWLVNRRTFSYSFLRNSRLSNKLYLLKICIPWLNMKINLSNNNTIPEQQNAKIQWKKMQIHIKFFWKRVIVDMVRWPRCIIILCILVSIIRLQSRLLSSKLRELMEISDASIKWYRSNNRGWKITVKSVIESTIWVIEWMVNRDLIIYIFNRVLSRP